MLFQLIQEALVPSVIIKYSERHFYVEKTNDVFETRLQKSNNSYSDWVKQILPTISPEQLSSLNLHLEIVLKERRVDTLQLRLPESAESYLKIESIPIFDEKGELYILQRFHGLPKTLDTSPTVSNHHEITYQSRLLKVSEQLVNHLFSDKDWHSILSDVFDIIGSTTNTDRIYYSENHLHPKTSEPSTSQIIEWSAHGDKPDIRNSKLQNIPIAILQPIMESLESKEAFVAIVREITNEELRKLLLEQGIKSILVLPVYINQQLHGFIGFSDCIDERVWLQDECNFFKTIIRNFESAIEKKWQNKIIFENEKKFRTLVEKGNDLFGIIDSQGVFNYVAGSSFNVLGISAEELVGTNSNDYIHHEDRGRVSQIMRSLEKHKQVRVPPYRFRNNTGEWIWIETLASDLREESGVQGIVINSKDVTERVLQKMQDDLMQSLRNLITGEKNLKSGLKKSLQLLTKFANVELGEVWGKSASEEKLIRLSAVKNSEHAQLFENEKTKVTEFEINIGLPGITWNNKSFQYWNDIDVHPNFIRKQEARECGLKYGYGVPIVYNNEIVVVFTFVTTKQRKDLAQFDRILKSLNEEIGLQIYQRQQREQFERFFRMSPDLLCLFGTDGFLKKINPAFKIELGYSEKVLLSTHVLEFVYQDDRELFKTAFEKAKLGLRQRDIRFRAICKDKTLIWVSWNSTGISEDGIIYGVGRNITSQIKFNKKLEQAYLQLETAQQIARIGYWEFDPSTKMHYWSPGTHQIYETDSDTFIPTTENILQFLSPEEHHFIDKDVEAAFALDDNRSFEHKVITKNGKIKWLAERGFLVRDKYGKPKLVKGTVQDITELKESELQAKISNERFEIAMKATSEMIWEWEVENDKFVTSRGLETTFGYKPDKTRETMKFWFDRIHEDDKDRVEKSFRNAIANPKKNKWKKEYRFYRADNIIVYVVDRGFIIRNKDGKAISAVGSVIDVTETIKQLNKIKIQNERLKEIAWTQSHIVRAPLSRLMGLAHLLEIESSQEHLRTEILTSASELDNIIREISAKTEDLN